MKKDKLKNIMEDTLKQSKSLLLRDGRVDPVAFMFFAGKIDIVALTFKNQREKEIQIRFLRKLVREKNADAVYMVTESWYVTSYKKDLSIMPSKHPMRKECIFIAGECEEGDVTIIQPFERKRGEGNKEIIIFEDIHDIDTISSNFNFGIKKIKKSNKNLGLNINPNLN